MGVCECVPVTINPILMFYRDCSNSCVSRRIARVCFVCWKNDDLSLFACVVRCYTLNSNNGTTMIIFISIVSLWNCIVSKLYFNLFIFAHVLHTVHTHARVSRSNVNTNTHAYMIDYAIRNTNTNQNGIWDEIEEEKQRTHAQNRHKYYYNHWSLRPNTSLFSFTLIAGWFKENYVCDTLY